MSLVFDSGLDVIDSGWTAGVVVVVGPGYVPDSDGHSSLADISDELGRANVTVAVTTSAGVQRVDFSASPSIGISGATAVGGWVLAADGANDAARVLVRWGDYAGGAPPDPFEVACPTGVVRIVA